MRRVVSLWFPTWPTDRLRRLPDAPPPVDRPLVTVVREGSRRLVTAADAKAQGLGIHAGMTVARAQATTPGLVVAEADPEADRATLEKLAAWCLRYAPVAAADPPDGIVIDITGCAHLFGGEGAMVADITGRMERAGYSVRAAIADTWAAAWGLARFAASPAIVPEGSTAEAIRSLPVAALRLMPETVATLRRLGFETIGLLAAVPRSSLALRFGSDLTRRINQAFGRMPEPIDPIVPPTTPSVRLAFAEPIVEGPSIAVALRRLAARLCAGLEAQGLGARRLDLLLTRVDRHVKAVRVGAARGTRDPHHIVRLFGEKLERIDPGLGIEASVLVASVVESLGSSQLTNQAVGQDEPDLSALVDRIANRIGEQHLYRLAPAESDIPERALRRVPALAPPTHANWPSDPRPARLLMPPEPVQVTALLPDHPPALFVWRGDIRKVRNADGPERLYGEWWRADGETDLVRDYFRVETEAGERFWMFRASDPEGARWFLHGIFP